MLVGIQVLNLILQLRLDADLAWSMAYVLGDFSEAPVPLFQPFVDEGRSDTGLSTLPDLNATPSPEPEPEAPAPAEEELLIRNREKVKEDLRILLQLGYDRQARRASAVEKIIGDLNFEGERSALSFYNIGGRTSLDRRSSKRCLCSPLVKRSAV